MKKSFSSRFVLLFSTVVFHLSTMVAFAGPSNTKDIERLKALVAINSGSANIKGVQAVMDQIKPWFEELGFQVEFKRNPEGDAVSAPMLIATYAGANPEQISFVLHADTVFEPSSPFQKMTVIEDHSLKGPGVMDDKGGIIVFLAAMREYLKPIQDAGKKPKFTLVAAVTPNEEVGAIGWWKTFETMSKKSWLALGLEPSFNEGGIVEGRKGNIWYEISVRGKEAHAGVDHAKGINACDILSDKITRLKKLTDYQKNVTVSVGHIEGGQDKYNIVCGWAKANLDTRVPNPIARKDLKTKIEAILNDPQVSYKIVDETAPMSTNAISKPLIRKYLDTIQRIEGKRYQAHVSGGVGDANHFAREGIAIIDGLGPIGKGMHTEEEQIDLRSIPTRAKILSEFLNSL
jgi:glutamate carboxypeptidase